MLLKPINADIESTHQKILTQYYQNKMIPPEKKNYLTQHLLSQGPYLAIESKNSEPTFLLDAASQIATLGLGFNSNEFMGTGHHWEAWTNNSKTENVSNIRKSFKDLLQRELNWNDTHMSLCNSGAEANEIALGQCYKYRKNLKAKKVLAFEGSFHGRMFISLFSTWNPSKREPFEFENFQTKFSPFPESKSSKINTEFPSKWTQIWGNSPLSNFQPPSDQDSQIQLEIQSLLNVREQLITGEIFSIIVEPMQCEGGDRFATNRFFSGLMVMAQAFDVPIIFDEVQTGFHLGRKFFWHRDLDLHNDNGESLYPDYVVCAKKSQVALVLSHQPILMNEHYQVASLIRGNIHAQALLQSRQRILDIQDNAFQRVSKLAENFSEHVEHPRARGLAFAIDVKDSSLVSKIIAERFKHALLFYPAGSNTLRFRMNTAMKELDMDFLFDGLEKIFTSVFLNSKTADPLGIETKDRNIQQAYRIHKTLIKSLLNQSENPEKCNNSNEQQLMEKISSFFEPFKLKLEVINAQNFQSFKSQISALQKEAYESTRQTSIDTFEETAKNKNSICLALTSMDAQNSLAAIIFSGPVSMFPMEGGVRLNSSKNNLKDNEKTLYMLDTTVAKEWQSRSIGFILKSAIKMLAQSRGIKEITGRNRDQLAGNMLRLNLSLGAYEKFHIAEDYKDNEKYRDVIFYGINTKWEIEAISLSNAIDSPLSLNQVDESFIDANLPPLVNKVCLSNFVSEEFLATTKNLFAHLPSSLQHGYTASGLSEALDKLGKTLRYTGKSNPQLLTIKNQYFGHGSFFSRSLSGDGEPFFPTTFLPSPFEVDEKHFLQSLEHELKNKNFLAFFLEPVEYKTLKALPKSLLIQIRLLCTQYKTPLVYNETCSSSYRYDNNHYCASNITEIAPDLGCIFLGGQGALVFTKEDYFIDKPLMMISTWDGDEASFANYERALNLIENDLKAYQQTKLNFETKLEKVLSKIPQCKFDIKNAIGTIQGPLPMKIKSLLDYDFSSYRVIPNYSQMEKFNKLDLEGHL